MIYDKCLRKIIFLFLVFSGCNLNNEYILTDSNATFVGKQTCIECHQREYNLWHGSDHDKAMDTASVETVKGDFNDVEFVWGGYTHRMYTKGGKYYVHTLGPDGKPGDFEIAYTFGVRPLQQYIVPFEDGRLQCLQITWDSDKSRWYHLSDSVHNGQDIQPNDWLYWTNNGQNMNGMCAECHTTNYKKNYDPKTNKFSTTWSEIDVSCEACHGPSSNHLTWAIIDSLERPKDINYGLVMQTSKINSKQYVDQCAYCHSRRSGLSNWAHNDSRVMNFMAPQLLSEPYFFADGQILEEDYVYASFAQSKMYKNHVKCNDCHNVHSLKTKFSGNALCYQCHDLNKYDTKDHHFHNGTGEMSLKSNNGFFDKGNGTQCVDCHMTGRYYMGVDFRRDHSFRNPRPDLTMEIGTPNACNECHTDKSLKWAADFIEKWYGKKPTPHFGTVMAAGRKGNISAIGDLIKISLDTSYTEMVRASALELMGSFQDTRTISAFNTSLLDSADIIRYIAVRNYYNINLADYVNRLSIMLKDSVKAVRIQAAYRLSQVPRQNIANEYRPFYNKEITEYITTLNHTADFAASKHNLGTLYSNLGQLVQAEESYKEALRIDDLFYPAKVNLAMLYNSMNRNDQAKQLFKEVIEEQPDYYEAYYSLGLLLAEEKKYREAINYLEIAVRNLSNRTRIYYNLALMYQHLGENGKAENSFNQLLNKEPNNIDYLYATAYFFATTKQNKKAIKLGNEMIKKHPNQRLGYEILKMISD